MKFALRGTYDQQAAPAVWPLVHVCQLLAYLMERYWPQLQKHCQGELADSLEHQTIVVVGVGALGGKQHAASVGVDKGKVIDFS